MMMENKENLKITVMLASLVLMLALSASLVSAIGVANSYWDDNPLKLAPGESKIISLRLQAEGVETTVRGTLDNPIARLIEGPEYTIPVGASVPVNISVEIPENADVGTKYDVYVSFQEISSGEGSMLRLSQGITGKVPVQVVGEQESELYGKTPKKNNLVWIVLGLIVLAVVLAVAMKRRE